MAGYPPTTGAYPQGQPVQAGLPPPAAPMYGVPTPPVYGAPAPVAPSQWQAGFFGCFEDCGLCIVTCFVPCITFGQTAEVIDNGVTSCATAAAICCLIEAVTSCSCFYSCTYRKKLRLRFGLPEEPCNDVCVHCCCWCCAFIQEYRELQLRGIDPAKGYQAYASHPVQQVPMQQYMRKE
ncbi:hypothetical protein KFL_002420170 [Klebsormidium nitens]|uniref:PLAC8 family protein n=1 Tax=Klebsormidium nitens TaxID=105231 RepID=A0A1Y1I3S2_KLENI|nr:hypothetical protein KFL_002420170 [Klebsormidium nitens]|eukprot:GAQ85584.1 hypothetical protein KFL_002420170 [Klebsormidium nitens]